MNSRVGWVWVALASLAAAPISAQTLNNQTLNGKFFFRHVSLGTDSSGNPTDPRSLIGTITFDGSGHFSYTGQEVIGTGSAASQTGSGVYSVDPAGFVSMDSPLRSGAKINARVGSSILLGSTTESTDNTYDVFAAILAPSSSVASTLAGPFWAVSLEFPGGVLTNQRDSFFGLGSSTAGQFSSITVTGHAANIGAGVPTTGTVSGATYTMGTDGSGSATFGPASNATLLSGSRTIYLSADGNTILGGSTAAGSHDFLLAVKADTGATNTSWNANFWSAGMGYDSTTAYGYAGAVSARGLGNLTWTKRFKELGSGSFDYTGVQTYTLNADGSGTVMAAGSPLGSIALGAGGKTFVGAIINGGDPANYEIVIGAQMNTLSGSGVFLNPQQVLNAASYAPAGNPIAPGEYLALFGTGLAPSPAVASKPPYPFNLNSVTVLINNKQAALYYVSSTQINVLVPYSTQGPTATVVVQNGAATSNTVTVPVAATAPGFFSSDQSGTGVAAVYHGNTALGLVTPTSPASPGETVTLYLTGMGAVSPAVNDGQASNELTSISASPIVVYVAGQPCSIGYSGLQPSFPGLYQLNVTLPLTISTTADVPMAIQTPNAFHDQVTLPVQ